MKVGVDGVLLGAWAGCCNPKRILDIGSGCGLIGLMLAQRYPSSEITAVEISRPAYEETKYNFENSRFADRCRAVHTAVQDFKTENRFDLIVSNPPYFEGDHNRGTDRGRARHQSDLSFAELIALVSALLAEDGRSAFIIPFDSEKRFIGIAAEMKLFPQRITRVKGNPDAPVKRSLIQLSDAETETETGLLTVEKSRNVYTEEYIELTKDFYLRM